MLTKLKYSKRVQLYITGIELHSTSTFCAPMGWCKRLTAIQDLMNLTIVKSSANLTALLSFSFFNEEQILELAFTWLGQTFEPRKS